MLGRAAPLLLLLLCAMLTGCVFGIAVRCPSLDPQYIEIPRFSRDKNSLAFYKEWVFVGHGKNMSLAGGVIVYKFDPNTNSWQEHQLLVAPDAQPYQQFGKSLTFDGDSNTLVVMGGSGNNSAAYVFDYNYDLDNWELKQQLRPSSIDVTIFVEYHALCGDYLAVNANQNLTVLYWFNASASAWQFSEILTIPTILLTSNDNYPAISCGGSHGDWLFVGARNHMDEPGFPAGIVYVYQLDGDAPAVLHQELRSTNDNEANFGAVIATDSNGWVVIGSGRTLLHLFEFDGHEFKRSQQQLPTASDFDIFGMHESINYLRFTLRGSRIGIGFQSFNHVDSIFSAGIILIYDLNSTTHTWERRQAPVIGTQVSQLIGSSVALYEDMIVSYGAKGVYFFNNSFIDMTPNTARDGNVPGLDIAFSNNNRSTAVNWDRFTENDTQRHITQYLIHTVDILTNITVYSGYHNNSSDAVFVHEADVFFSDFLPLPHNSSYMTTVSVANCVESRTTGYLVDVTAPLPGSVLLPETVWSSNTSIFTKWTSFVDLESGIDRYEVSILDTNTSEVVQPFVSVGQKLEETISFGFPSPIGYGRFYTLLVRGFNGANTSTTISHDFYMADLRITEIRDFTFSPTSILKTGHFISIHWVSFGINGTQIWLSIIDALTNNTAMNITYEFLAVESQHYDWEAVSILLPPGLYRIVADSSFNMSNIRAFSSLLTVEDGGAYIVITHPNETSVWGTGHYETITWTSRGTLNVTLDLYCDGKFLLPMGEQTAEAGRLAWFVDHDFPRSTMYQIKARSTNNSAVVFFSRPFEIDNPKSLSVVKPALNSSEYWVAGQSHTIVWVTTGTLSSLNIRVLTQMETGEAITEIASDVNFMDLSIDWTLPETTLNGESNYVEISCPKYGLLDTSKLFEIDKLKTITISTPSEETVADGDEVELSWYISGKMAGFDIEVVSDTGDEIFGVLHSNFGPQFVTLEARDLYAPNGTETAHGRHRICIRVRSTRYPTVVTSSPSIILPLNRVSSSSDSEGGTGVLLIVALSTGALLIILLLLIAIIVGIVSISAVLILALKQTGEKSDFTTPGSTELVTHSLMSTSPQEEVSIEYQVLEIPINKIEIQERVGKGSFGEVFKAKYQGSFVAFKKLAISMDLEILNEFRKEAQIMAHLNHPKLLQFIGICSSQGVFGIVTEFMEQGSLLGLLRADPQNLPWWRRLSILSDVAAGMEFIHSQGVIHRDLKSGNILVNESFKAKVADFGQARMIDRSVTTMTERQGTPLYMAPEVISSSGLYTNKCDVFSFGVVMWEMLTEKEPYFDQPNKQSILFQVAKNPEFRPTVPTFTDSSISRDALLASSSSLSQLQALMEQFVALMRQCWSHDPNERPAFEELINSLQLLAPQLQ